MAHFAELDENNIVIQVVVVDDLDTRVKTMTKTKLWNTFFEEYFWCNN